MVDSQVDAARQLSLTSMKNLKRFINIEIAGHQGPSAEYAGAARFFDFSVSCIACIVCICVYFMYRMYA